MLIKILSRQKGFSLVELMISLALGLVVMGGVLSVVTSILATNTSMLKMTRLNQELRAVMMMLTRDLRRAGNYGEVVENVLAGTQSISNPFSEISVNADKNCILFRYDSNGDGVLDDNEHYGFRLDTENKAIEIIRQEGATATCEVKGDGKWENITDEESIEITAMKIEDLSPSLIPLSSYSVSLRQFRITLTGQLKDDPAVVRTLKETIKVRNNQVL